MNINSRPILILPLAAAAWISLAQPARLPAAVANVSVINFSFSPATTSINVNDQVLWTWNSGSVGHNVTSTSNPQAWTPSTTQHGSVTFSHTFTSAGTFPYECTIHASLGMKGSVSVAAVVNPPPAVTLTSPTNGMVLAAPASVTLKAITSDSAGTVTNVEFLIGSTVVSNCSAAPFLATTDNLAAGNYSVSAVAMDNLGGNATNTAAVSVVNPVAVAINALQTSPGRFQFSYTANEGLNYVVQKTTNLATAEWVPVTTNQAVGNPVIFVDLQATSSPAFYRVSRLPNP